MVPRLPRSGGPLWRRWTYAGVHRGDGTMTGRVAWSGGGETATGAWEVTADGLYWRTWNTTSGAGERGCFAVSRENGTLVFDHVSGTRGDSARYLYEPVPGTPHGL